MRVLVFHGYLLRGTGSNVYNARLCAALARAGHSVDLLCQEPRPEELDFVDAVGTWEGGDGARRDAARAGARDGVAPGHRPPAAGLRRRSLRGLRGAHAAGCSDAEIEAYVQANVAAVRDVCARAAPDVALANHLVMGPAIVARGLDGDVALRGEGHGSALEYVVKRDPRALPAVGARGPRAGARAVLVGSRHTGESLWAAMAGPRPARAHAAGAAGRRRRRVPPARRTPPRASRR